MGHDLHAGLRETVAVVLDQHAVHNGWRGDAGLHALSCRGCDWWVPIHDPNASAAGMPDPSSSDAGRAHRADAVLAALTQVGALVAPCDWGVRFPATGDRIHPYRDQLSALLAAAQGCEWDDPRPGTILRRTPNGWIEHTGDEEEGVDDAHRSS